MSVVVAANALLWKGTAEPLPSAPGTLYDFTMDNIKGEKQPLKAYEGKVVLVVNVASRCGLTPQYEGLERIYEQYKEKGFVVLGFPANNFNGQEPGTNEEILEFCTGKYDVTFPMFSKISVKGEDIDPLYKWLVESTGGTDIEWNFSKFLIAKDGTIAKRFGSRIAPDDAALIAMIEEELGK
ncbi:MAG: glutathione peroxidase [Fimbriimonadaceae bacterium]|nr:glutathione peroxidase [Fimbriimonadaceae bacterium]